LIDETLEVVVRFGARIPPTAQGIALLAFEKHLRSLTGLDCRVFKDKMGDDSKLRVKMTPIERERI
jgi:hypothetical protein